MASLLTLPSKKIKSYSITFQKTYTNKIGLFDTSMALLGRGNFFSLLGLILTY